jgi:hypothetical protein
MNIKSLIRPFKPWLIPSRTWKSIEGLAIDSISTELGCSIVVAKPSENLYLGKPVGDISGAAAAIVNLASHGEMAVSRIVLADGSMPDKALERLVNILPTQVVVGSEKIGLKKGKLLNHFGYRKVVMSLIPETLEDHAWIASALSYSVKAPTALPDYMFDPIGGGLAGGMAGVTKDGGIFRGSGIADQDGFIITAGQALNVSLAANGVQEDVVDRAECLSDTDFHSHRFYSRLVSMLR